MSISPCSIYQILNCFVRQFVCNKLMLVSNVQNILYNVHTDKQKHENTQTHIYVFKHMQPASCKISVMQINLINVLNIHKYLLRHNKMLFLINETKNVSRQLLFCRYVTYKYTSRGSSEIILKCNNIIQYIFKYWSLLEFVNIKHSQG